MSQENKRIARRYFIEIMNMGNMDTLYQLLSSDFIFTLATHPEPYHGPDGFRELVMMLHEAFPDFYINIQEMVAQDDTVVTRWRGGGTHTGGPLRTVQGNIQASGRSFEIDGMTWHRIANGKIVESLANEDTVGLLMQLGVFPSGQEATAPSPEQSRSLVGRYFDDLMSQGRMEVADEILDPHFTFNIPTQPQPIHGLEAFKGFVSYLRSAFPDIKFTVEREIVDGNRVASRWMITGTHQGEFLGAPPTHKQVKDYGIDVFTIANGRITSVHVNENDLGLMQQLGMIPAMQQAET